MEEEVPTVRVGATPTGLMSPPPPQSPTRFFTGRMPFLPPNQQRQSTEGFYFIFFIFYFFLFIIKLYTE